MNTQLNRLVERLKPANSGELTPVASYMYLIWHSKLDSTPLVVYLQDSERQRLIYSGKLLNDDQTLKNVLRQPVCLCVCVCLRGEVAVHGHVLYLYIVYMIMLGKENEHGCVAGLFSLLDSKWYFMSIYYYPPHELDGVPVFSLGCLGGEGGGAPPIVQIYPPISVSEAVAPPIRVWHAKSICIQ